MITPSDVKKLKTVFATKTDLAKTESRLEGKIRASEVRLEGKIQESENRLEEKMQQWHSDIFNLTTP